VIFANCPGQFALHRVVCIITNNSKTLRHRAAPRGVFRPDKPCSPSLSTMRCWKTPDSVDSKVPRAVWYVSPSGHCPKRVLRKCQRALGESSAIGSNPS